MSLLLQHPRASVERAQDTLPLKIVEFSVPYATMGTRMLVRMTWPCLAEVLPHLDCDGVGATVTLRDSDLRPTS